MKEHSVGCGPRWPVSAFAASLPSVCPCPKNISICTCTCHAIHTAALHEVYMKSLFVLVGLFRHNIMSFWVQCTRLSWHSHSLCASCHALHSKPHIMTRTASCKPTSTLAPKLACTGHDKAQAQAQTHPATSSFWRDKGSAWERAAVKHAMKRVPQLVRKVASHLLQFMAYVYSYIILQNMIE